VENKSEIGAKKRMIKIRQKVQLFGHKKKKDKDGKEVTNKIKIVKNIEFVRK
jgi:hypothetical protein